MCETDQLENMDAAAAFVVMVVRQGGGGVEVAMGIGDSLLSGECFLCTSPLSGGVGCQVFDVLRVESIIAPLVSED